MKTVFLGGSRNVSHLSDLVRSRLDTIIEKQLPIVVGDANGADKAFQSYLFTKHYEHVEVFCAQGKCRNNVGNWNLRGVPVKAGDRGFKFYTAKDLAMATEADLGFMLWDGKSTGTLVNAFVLVSSQKAAVIYNAPKRMFLELKTDADWNDFAATWTNEIRSKFQERIAALALDGSGPSAQLTLLEKPVSALKAD